MVQAEEATLLAKVVNRAGKFIDVRSESWHAHVSTPPTRFKLMLHLLFLTVK